MAAAADSVNVTDTSLFLALSHGPVAETTFPSTASNGFVSGKTTQKPNRFNYMQTSQLMQRNHILQQYIFFFKHRLI